VPSANERTLDRAIEPVAPRISLMLRNIATSMTRAELTAKVAECRTAKTKRIARQGGKEDSKIRSSIAAPANDDDDDDEEVQEEDARDNKRKQPTKDADAFEEESPKKLKHQSFESACHINVNTRLFRPQTCGCRKSHDSFRREIMHYIAS
jgi:hypothetical protein